MNKWKYIFCWFWMLAGMEVYAQTTWHEAVAQGLRFQEQADSLQRIIEADKTRNLDAQVAALQKTADEWFARAVAFEAPVAVIDTLIKTAESVEMMEEKENLETKNIRKSEFAILPKSTYSATNPIPVDEPLPDGVVYMIQLGAFSKPLPANTFKGLTPISGEKLPNGITKYYAGLFYRFADAESALRKVHEYGFKDAFIVAFYNRKTINPERAKQLETATIS
jgi:hypothetical protein